MNYMNDNQEVSLVCQLETLKSFRSCAPPQQCAVSALEHACTGTADSKVSHMCLTSPQQNHNTPPSKALVVTSTGADRYVHLCLQLPGKSVVTTQLPRYDFPNMARYPIPKHVCAVHKPLRCPVFVQCTHYLISPTVYPSEKNCACHSQISVQISLEDLDGFKNDVFIIAR